MADYNPVGAMGGLFAPAFIRGNPQSEQAVQDWKASNWFVTNPIVEQSRQVVPGVNTGNPAGMVDIEALRALAQGGPYTGRNSIAAAMTTQPSGGGAGGSGIGGAGGLAPSYISPAGPQYDPRQIGGLGGPGGGGYGPGTVGFGVNGNYFYPFNSAGGGYSQGGPVAPGLAPPQVNLGVS